MTQNEYHSDNHKADLQEVAQQCTHLSAPKQQKLCTLLKRYEFLFDGTLGTWKTTPIDLELKDDAKPYHAKPFPVPRAHDKVFREEIDRLCDLGILKRCNDSEWEAPCFIQPKKNGTVWFLTDFREVNKLIRRKPFPIPNIQEILLKLEGFTYATSLDLNMGYYHIQLTPASRRICTIVLPWGKYEYCRLPMGLCNSPDIFQEKINELFYGFEHVRAYIDDVLTTTKGDWDDHLYHLEKVLQKLAEAGLKVNADKSFFGRHECEYLGYWVTRDGIRPLAKKVEAMSNLSPPKTVKQVRRFVGLVNYYRDMWPQRAHILAPLTRLTSSKVKFKWTEKEQTAFEEMKSLIGRDALLAYPDFSKEFVIHADASKTQLGAVITQNGKPIAFYSRKLSDAQTRYSTTERELLSIVETLKEFRSILLGQRIKIYTDHKNLTFKNFNTDRVMRWRLIIEEYGPELVYVKGLENVAADALSRLARMSKLPTTNDPQTFKESFVTDKYLAERYDVDKVDVDVCPVSYKMLHKYQNKDESIQTKLKASKLLTQPFRGADNDIQLACHKGRIYVPKALRKTVIEWYHTYLMHPGATRTEETLKQHLYWPGLQEDVKAIVLLCPTCQKSKKETQKYGHLPAKEAEVAVPWERLCVDLIGPYTIRRVGKHTPNLKLKAVTMIDPATGWFEIVPYDDKRSMTVANLVEMTWLTRYPRPSTITIDRGGEFIGHPFREELCGKEYNIKIKMATTANPQANSIIERVHLTLANMVRTRDLQKSEDIDFDWQGVLAAAAYGIRSTYHTTLRATPGQLVFGRDMLFNIQHIADWRAIKQRRQEVINQNNRRENSKRIRHKYRVGDKVLFRNKKANKYEQPYLGPYKIIKVFQNGTITLQKGAVSERVNIRWVKPYRN